MKMKNGKAFNWDNIKNEMLYWYTPIIDGEPVNKCYTLGQALSVLNNHIDHKVQYGDEVEVTVRIDRTERGTVSQL